jgi:hypothetical protein
MNGLREAKNRRIARTEFNFLVSRGRLRKRISKTSAISTVATI